MDLLCHSQAWGWRLLQNSQSPSYANRAYTSWHPPWPHPPREGWTVPYSSSETGVWLHHLPQVVAQLSPLALVTSHLEDRRIISQILQAPCQQQKKSTPFSIAAVWHVSSWYGPACLLNFIPLMKMKSESCSVVSDCLWPHGLYSPWNSPGQNTGGGSHSQPRDQPRSAAFQVGSLAAEPPGKSFTFHVSLSNPSQGLVDSFSNGDRFLPYTYLLECFSSLWFCTICSFLKLLPPSPTWGLRVTVPNSHHISLWLSSSHFIISMNFDICKVNHSFPYTNFITCLYFQTYFIVIMHLNNISPTRFGSH